MVVVQGGLVVVPGGGGDSGGVQDGPGLRVVVAQGSGWWFRAQGGPGFHIKQGAPYQILPNLARFAIPNLAESCKVRHAGPC